MKNNELLRLINAPVFSNEMELASLMHIERGTIKMLSEYSYRYYRKYSILKTNGKLREIRQPRRDLKGIQAWILRNILDRLTPSTYATAYIKNKNIVNNVLPHKNNRYFICLDMEEFFPSISFNRVYRIFILMGYCSKASSILASLCTCLDSLPQGAVTSPSLSNIIASKLDRRLAGYTSRRNITYTRYSDDITLSSNNPNILCKSLPRVLKIIKSEHFIPSQDKLRVLGPRKRCAITGFVKNNSASSFSIGKNKKHQMRAVMHHFVFNLCKDEKYVSERSIIGWLNYLKNVDTASYEQMNDYWQKLQKKRERSAPKT